MTYLSTHGDDLILNIEQFFFEISPAFLNFFALQDQLPMGSGQSVS